MYGQLQVTVIDGHLRKNKEWFGRADPFAVVYVGGASYRTRTDTDGGKHPKWNQTFTFQLNGDNLLRICIFDKDIFTSNDFIAEGTIEISRLLSQNFEHHVPLRRKDRDYGHVRIRTCFMQGMMAQPGMGMMGQQGFGMMGQPGLGMMGQPGMGMMGQPGLGMMGQPGMGMMGQPGYGMMGQQGYPNQFGYQNQPFGGGPGFY